MEIKVNDYVRTRWGCIAKFEGIHEGFYDFDNIIMDESSGVKENLFVDIVEKSSPNIIDLIEVGDYVNGRIVDDYIYLDKLGLIGLTELEKEDEKFIKSIVTKEMYSNVEYRVERN